MFIKRVFIFIGVLLVFAALTWIGGYNFDARSPDIAFLCLISIVVALSAASFPFEEM